MSERFLNDECFGEDKKNLVSELKEHMNKAEILRCSFTVKQLKNQLKSIFTPHLRDLSNMPQINIELHNPWNDANIQGLYLLVRHLLPHKSKHSILEYIEIQTGSVRIKYFVDESKADCLIAYAQGKLHFMRLIGIFGLTINGKPILEEDENMNFTFESALLEATKAGHDEAVQFLLEIRGNLDHCSTALMSASRGGHEQIVQTVNASLAIALTIACQYGHSQLIISLVTKLLHILTPEELQCFTLCAKGDHISLESHLSDFNVDINCTLVNDITPLMIASSCGHTETVQVLLQAGANVNSTDNDGYSPLVYAITGHKSLQVIEQLLKAGAQPNVFINDQTIVDKVREEGREDICKLMQCFQLLQTFLQQTSSAGNNDGVQFLLGLIGNATIDHRNEEGSTALMLASKDGHEQVVQTLLLAGANVNIQDNEGWTALMRASERNHLAIVNTLIQEGADPNLQKSNGSNALMIASFGGHYDIVQVLLQQQQKTDVNYQRKDGCTALMLASQNGHTQVIELLLKENAEVNTQNEVGWTALIMACQNGYTQVVKILLNNCANVNIQNKYGLTALMVASHNGYTLVVDLLLKECAHINIQKGDGWTALMLASLNGHTQVVKLLLKQHADVNIQEEYGFTALMLASLNGDKMIVELLLKNRADPDHQRFDGATSLIIANDNNHIEIVQLLLEAKADPNAQYKDSGITVLMSAVLKGHPEIVRQLLIYGANPNIRDKEGDTALHAGIFALALGVQYIHECFLNYLKSIILLIQAENIDVNIKGKKGATVLMLASEAGISEIVYVLLQKNADINTQDEHGWTALMLASKNGHTQVVELLSKEYADINTQDEYGWLL